MSSVGGVGGEWNSGDEDEQHLLQAEHEAQLAEQAAMEEAARRWLQGEPVEHGEWEGSGQGGMVRAIGDTDYDYDDDHHHHNSDPIPHEASRVDGHNNVEEEARGAAQAWLMGADDVDVALLDDALHADTSTSLISHSVLAPPGYDADGTLLEDDHGVEGGAGEGSGGSVVARVRVSCARMLRLARKYGRAEAAALGSLLLVNILSNVVMFGMGITDQIFLGHLGELELSAAIVGTAFAWITGFLCIGIGFGQDTLSSQAFGAGHLTQLGVVLQTCMALMGMVMVPILLMWWNAGLILKLFVQTDVASLASTYVRYLMPGFPAISIVLAIKGYLTAQQIVWPYMVAGTVSFLANIFLNWFFIHYIGLGFIGSPLATSVSRWIFLLGLLGIIFWRKLHKPTWSGWTLVALKRERFLNYARYGIPVALMIVLEVGGFEGTAFIAGTMDPVQTAAHAVAYNLFIVAFVFPNAMAISLSARVGAFMGESRPDKAQLSALIGQGMAVCFSLVTIMPILFGRNVVGRVFSNDDDVVAVVASLAPVIAWAIPVDCFQVSAMGTLRGMGRPTLGTILNASGYYVLGIPLAIAFGIGLDKGVVGIWTGVGCGLTWVSVSGAVALLFSPWKKLSDDAVERMREEQKSLRAEGVIGADDDDDGIELTYVIEDSDDDEDMF